MTRRSEYAGRKIAPVARRSDQPLPPLYDRRDLPRILSGCEHAREIAAVLADETSHARAGWRQARWEDSLPKLSRLAPATNDADPDALAVDDTAAMADRSLSVEDATAARDLARKVSDAVATMRSDARAVFLSDAGIAPAPSTSDRTIKRRRADARALLGRHGVDYGDAAAVAAYLGADLLGVGRPRLVPPSRKATPMVPRSTHGPVLCYAAPFRPKATVKTRRGEASMPDVAVVEMTEVQKAAMRRLYDQRARKAA